MNTKFCFPDYDSMDVWFWYNYVKTLDAIRKASCLCIIEEKNAAFAITAQIYWTAEPY